MIPSSLVSLTGARWLGPWVRHPAEIGPGTPLRRDLPAPCNLIVSSSSDAAAIPAMSLVLPAPASDAPDAGLSAIRPRLVALLCAARGRNVPVSEEIARQRPIARVLKRPLAIYVDHEDGAFDLSVVPRLEYGDQAWLRASQIHATETADDIETRLAREVDYSPCGRVVLVVRAWSVATLVPVLVAVSRLAANMPAVVGVVWRTDDGAFDQFGRVAAPYLVRLGQEIGSTPEISDLGPLPSLSAR